MFIISTPLVTLMAMETVLHGPSENRLGVGVKKGVVNSIFLSTHTQKTKQKNKPISIAKSNPLKSVIESHLGKGSYKGPDGCISDPTETNYFNNAAVNKAPPPYIYPQCSLLKRITDVCMCVLCMYVFVCVHVYLCTYLFVYVCLLKRITDVCMCVLCMYVFVCVHVYLCTYLFVYMWCVYY